jgi:hypothetical protein
MDEEKFDLDKYISDNSPKETENVAPTYRSSQADVRSVDNEIDSQQRLQDQANQEELLRKATVAGLGTSAGALLRHKGVEAKNIFSPGQNVYQPSEKSIQNINVQLRQKTGDPTLDFRALTPEQVSRILSGGEGPTLGTTGRQRQEGFSLEGTRRSRTQNEIEDFVNKNFPATRDPFTSIGEPLVPLKNDIIIPRSVATQEAEKTTSNTLKAINEAEKSAKMSGIKSGLTKAGVGALGGALTGLQAYNMATQDKPLDWSHYLSLLGNLGVTFGGPKIGTIGGLAQIPYAIKHRDELAHGMTYGDINPTVFGGMPEASESPFKSILSNKQ